MPADQKNNSNTFIKGISNEFCLLSKVQPQENAKPRYRFKASDSRINLNGYRIATDGMDLARFIANPQIFFNHDTWGFPVGLGFDTETIGDDLFVNIEFHGLDEDSVRVERLVAAGVIKYVSVGVNALELSEVFDVATNGSYTNVTKSQLREISVVPLPANLGAGLQEVLNSAEQETGIKISDDDRQWLQANMPWGDVNAADKPDGEINSDNIHNQRTNMKLEELLEENASLKANAATTNAELEKLKASHVEASATIENLQKQVAQAAEENKKATEIAAAAALQVAEAKELVAAAEVKALIIELGDKITPAENSADNKFKLEKNLIHLKLHEDTIQNAFGESIYSQTVAELKAREGHEHLRRPLGTKASEGLKLRPEEIDLNNSEHNEAVNAKALEIAKTKEISYREALTIVLKEGI